MHFAVDPGQMHGLVTRAVHMEYAVTSCEPNLVADCNDRVDTERASDGNEHLRSRGRYCRKIDTENDSEWRGAYCRGHRPKL